MKFIFDSVKYNRKGEAIGVLFEEEHHSIILAYTVEGKFYEVSVIIDEGSDIIVED